LDQRVTKQTARVKTPFAPKKSFASVASPTGQYDIFLLDMRESPGNSANLSYLVQ